MLRLFSTLFPRDRCAHSLSLRQRKTNRRHAVRFRNWKQCLRRRQPSSLTRRTCCQHDGWRLRRVLRRFVAVAFEWHSALGRCRCRSVDLSNVLVFFSHEIILCYLQDTIIVLFDAETNHCNLDCLLAYWELSCLRCWWKRRTCPPRDGRSSSIWDVALTSQS